jgi:hypothetical protein
VCKLKTPSLEEDPTLEKPDKWFWSYLKKVWMLNKDLQRRSFLCSALKKKEKKFLEWFNLEDQEVHFNGLMWKDATILKNEEDKIALADMLNQNSLLKEEKYIEVKVQSCEDDEWKLWRIIK